MSLSPYCANCSKKIGGFFSSELCVKCGDCGNIYCESCFDSMNSERIDGAKLLAMAPRLENSLRTVAKAKRMLKEGPSIGDIVFDTSRAEERQKSIDGRLDLMPTERLVQGVTFNVCGECKKNIRSEALANIELLKKRGRFEDAARVYEIMGMDEQAGQLRTKDRTVTVRNVNVDLNQLLDKLKTGGFVIPYKCPNCGATIRIDKESNANALQFCSYCGTTTNVDAIYNLLKLTLG